MELGGSPTSHLLAGQLLYAGLQDFSIVGYDLAKGPGIRFSGHSGRVNQLARDPTIGTLYSCSSDGTINFWDQRSGKSFTTLRSGSPGQIVTLDYRENYLAFGQDSTLLLYDVRVTKPLIRDNDCHSQEIRSVRFSREGQALLAGAFDGLLIICDARARSVDDFVTAAYKDEQPLGSVFLLGLQTALLLTSISSLSVVDLAECKQVRDSKPIDYSGEALTRLVNVAEGESLAYYVQCRRTNSVQVFLLDRDADLLLGCISLGGTEPFAVEQLGGGYLIVGEKGSLQRALLQLVRLEGEQGEKEGYMKDARGKAQFKPY